MNDLEFVRRCVTGDKAAWDEFLSRYSRLIYNYILNILNTKGWSFTQDHINDVFQEIFYSLIKDNFRKLKSFQAKNGCRLASWLRQVTINCTIDYLRRIKPAVSIEEETEEGFSLKDVLASPAAEAPDTISDKEKIKQLRECINRLSQDDKYFLELHLYQGLRLQDLMGILGLSRGGVDMHKARIIERLRECFKGKGFGLDF